MGSTAPARLLVVEHESALREALCGQLRSLGYAPVAAGTTAEALHQLGAGDIDVALLALAVPDGSAIEILRRIGEDELTTEAIVLAGHPGEDAAIEAMKRGACAYLPKAARIDELEALVQKAGEKARLRRENASLKVRLGRQERGVGLITEDAGMQEVMATVARIAPSDQPILVQGEGGTGKELVARAIHAASPRAQQPFVAIRCAAGPDDQLESDLFGHEKGSGAAARKPGLFEVANKGVLFLDEIDEAAPAVQSKLLRALETREVLRAGAARPVRTDVRIVSATRNDVKAERHEGRFPEELLARLNGVTIRLPPLRERRGDIPLLARHFLGSVGPRKQLTPRALETLSAYGWPGNVRELQMVVHRAAMLAPTDTIDVEDLPVDIRDQGSTGAARGTMSLAEVEREHIETVLRRNEGHRGKTARALGIDPKTLYNKLGPERPRKKA